MISGYKPVEHVEATVFARLPDALRHDGEPTEWVKVTRPGQTLDAFLEGAYVAPHGRLWVVDIPYGRLFSVGAEADWVLEYQYDGEPHAVVSAGDGALYVTDYKLGLMRFDLVTRTLESVLPGINTERFRGLGDMARAPNGDIWFSDAGRSSLSEPTGRVFRMRNGTGKVELVLGNLPYPNGIAFSPDGKSVHIAVTRANAVWKFLADAPDPLFPMLGNFIQLSGGLGPDGLAMRDDGILAVAHAQAGRAFLFDRLGDMRAVVTTPGGLWTTAVAFSANGNDLFIVDAQTSSIYRADVSALRF